MQHLQIHPSDNVAVALEDLPAKSRQEVLLRETIQRGHKYALREIAPGEKIIKYGMAIGHAKQKILPGEHVHVHNIETLLGELLEYTYEPEKTQLPTELPKRKTFLGYRRKNGQCGVRNHLWIVPTVGCVNALAQSLARAFEQESGERVLALTHPFGCSQLGTDHALTRKILADFVRHPNAGGVLVLGLGCENNTMEGFQKELGSFDTERVRFLIAQEAEDEFQEGMKFLRQLYELKKQDQRVEIPLSELKVGLKCGGSDGLSGVTANPLVGSFSDRLAVLGGTTILSEVPEMFGAETILMNRCVSRKIFDKCVAMINDFKRYFTRYNQTIYENPSPGNKAGGISTLEDKSMGCTQKAGNAPVQDVLAMGESVREKGLNLLNGPGNDMAATTLLAAAGAHLILFTTGRGTPFGTVVPTLKISSNTALAEKKSHWIDFDAGRLIQDGAVRQEIEEAFFELVCDCASGKECRNETLRFEEISIFKDGVTL